MRFVRTIVLLGVAISTALAGVGTSSAAVARSAGTTCSGGDIASGTYRSLTVTGFCSVPDGAVITVEHNLTVAPKALLFAISMSTLRVGGNLLVESGAALGLGCAPSAGCPGFSNDVIGHNLIGDEPLAMIVHGNTIEGNVISSGGGGGVTCDSTALGGGPPFSAFEDNVVGGNVTVSGLRTCWFGFFRNQVQKNVALTGNITADPDGNEVTDNVISGNLACFANAPASQIGDSGGGPNTVGKHELGQCAGL